MCDPSQCKGNLKVRSDWSIKVQDFFVNNSAMEFVRSTFDFVDAPNLLRVPADDLSSCHRNLTGSTPPSLPVSADHSGCSHFLMALQQVCLCYVTILRANVLPIHTVRLCRSCEKVQLEN